MVAVEDRFVIGMTVRTFGLSCVFSRNSYSSERIHLTGHGLKMTRIPAGSVATKMIYL
jgi:hypothetical protein